MHAAPQAVLVGTAGDDRVTVMPGARGLLDATVMLGNGAGPGVSFRGFEVRVAGAPLEAPASSATLLAVHDESGGGVVAFRHGFASPAGSFDLVIALRVDRGALRADLALDHVPEARPWDAVRIESAGLGPWSARPRRLYAGEGNVLIDPGRFRLPYDGHFLATSCVGIEFGSGPAVVEGVSVPPDALDIDGPAHRAGIVAPLDQTIWVIPARTAWAAAAVWRELDGRDPAGGFERLKGRMVFDCWGGRYTDAARALQRSFRYGLTDAAVIWHQWQRWGYDFRLPDIWPPNPEFGSTAEFAALAAACRAQDVLFAPHDNYIDAYPDAQGYELQNIAYAEDRQPVKAWFNAWRHAQSFRFRPDRFQPFLERNLALVRSGASPTAYFVDVFSSISLYDGWTQAGVFFDRRLTRQRWSEAFDRIRQTLDGAPTISESGHDALIGHLDGATANHLRVDPRAPEKIWSVWRTPCADAERIPWMDFLHHQRFAAHGAGYEDRYAAGLSVATHGIYGNDYLSTEVLTGHPPMVSSPFGRDVVRVGWLLGPVGRALAGRRIESVEFAGGDIHRETVRWEGGGLVEVNRGDRDWSTGGVLLPQYGFHARIPAPDGIVEAAIERRSGAIVEWSRNPRMWYVNAQPLLPRIAVVASPPPALSPDGTLAMGFTWIAARPCDQALRAFVHLTDRAGAILFQADYDLPVSTTAWSGTVPTRTSVSVPGTARPGDSYEVRVGLYHPAGAWREPLDGADDGERRIVLGEVTLAGKGARVTGLRWRPRQTPTPSASARSPVEVDFGGLATAGAVRLSSGASGWLVTPLPGGGACTVRLLPARWPGQSTALHTATSLGEDGSELATVPLEGRAAAPVLRCAPGVFAYLLR